jgi:hypothetical protein
MPPPMISMRLGMSPSSSASVESIKRGSSHGKPGNFTACEPAAMMQLSKDNVLTPSLVSMLSDFGEANFAVP